MNLLRRFFGLFNRRDRVRLAVLGLLLLIMSLFELAIIGIILPFIKVVGEPAILLGHERIGPMLRSLGVTEPRGVILVACTFMLGVFVAKGLFVAVTWRMFYTFVY